MSENLRKIQSQKPNGGLQVGAGPNSQTTSNGDIVESIIFIIGDSVKDAGITLIKGQAKFVDRHQLSIESTADGIERTSLVSAQHIVVAVSGQPMKLDILGIELALTLMVIQVKF